MTKAQKALKKTILRVSYISYYLDRKIQIQTVKLLQLLKLYNPHKPKL